MEKQEIVLTIAGDLAVKLLGDSKDSALLAMQSARDKKLDAFSQGFKRLCRIVSENYDEIS